MAISYVHDNKSHVWVSKPCVVDKKTYVWGTDAYVSVEYHIRNPRELSMGPDMRVDKSIDNQIYFWYNSCVLCTSVFSFHNMNLVSNRKSNQQIY